MTAPEDTGKPTPGLTPEQLQRVGEIAAQEAS
jgi:hypothetical protein